MNIALPFSRVGRAEFILHTRENFIRLESILGGIYDEEERFPGHY